MSDHYQTLGIAKTATDEEVKAAYRKLAMQFHPDRNPGDKAAETKFKEVQDAYDVLSDPQKKRQYDNPNPGWPFDTIIKQFHEQFFGGDIDRGRNIQVRVEVTLAEANTGCTKSITINKRDRCANCQGNGYLTFNTCQICGGKGITIQNNPPFVFQSTCTRCNGTGKQPMNPCTKCKASGFIPAPDKKLDVVIPPGVETGMQIRIQGEGEQAKKSARAGDLFVVVIVQNHKLLIRNGPDLTCMVPVSYTQLVRGGTIKVPTLDGSMDFIIPAATASHAKFRITGKGLNKVGSTDKGDLIVVVHLETASNLPEEYNKVLVKLAELEEKHLGAERKKYQEDLKTL